MSAYEHQQTGVPLLAVFVLSALALAVLAAVGDLGLVGWLAAALLILAGWILCSMRIEIVDEHLVWQLGPGIFRKRVALTDIAGAEATRTTWMEGWGIRLTRRGWLYNVSGLDAVLVERRDGKKFLLGTDEPQRLAAAINRRVANAASPPTQ